MPGENPESDKAMKGTDLSAGRCVAAVVACLDYPARA